MFLLASVSELVRVKRHKPGGPCHPWRRMFQICLTCKVWDVNLAVQPRSQKFLMDMREFHASPGSMCPACACVGNFSSWSWHSFVDRMEAPLGMPAPIGGGTCGVWIMGELGLKKCPVSPVSATPIRMVVGGDRCCARLTYGSRVIYLCAPPRRVKPRV